jgi:UDP:flavonoid glycosyltransferase YjiC (YdhE family)
MMHAILAPLGTDGDVLPYVGLGRALRRRGHEVTLVASAQYQGLAFAHSLGFQELVSAEESQELFEHPDFWHPRKTVKLSARWGLRFIKRQFELLAGLANTANGLLIANPAVFAARLVHERFAIPYVTLILQPWIIASSIQPPVMPGFRFLSHAPRLIWTLFWRGLDLVGDRLLGPELNRVRTQIGLKPTRRILGNWLSPQLVLGMFPEWYAAPQADWPNQLRLVGFPMFDGEQQAELPRELLEFCEIGPAPIAFTFGTGMRHSATLFQTALEACRLSGYPGVFLTRHRDQLPDALPPHVFHCEFASFQWLFPRCAAVVHHGGIGTVAAALAAATPQLIMPVCFDQMDNGARVKALGTGDWLHARRRTAQAVVNALRGVTGEETKMRCRSVAKRFERTDALATAAERIEAFASSQRTTTFTPGARNVEARRLSRMLERREAGEQSF